MKDIITISKSNNVAALKIETQVNNLIGATTPLDELFMIERGNLLTADLEALDTRRDAAITGLRLAATAFTYHFDATISNAATVIASGIDKHGTSLARLNYIAETEVIESLVADCTTNAEMTTAIATLQLQAWVAELDAANKAFNQLYISRTSSYASKPQGSLTELRVTTTAAYSALAAHITAHNTLNPSDGYTKLIAELNSLTDQYNRLAENRGNTGVEEPAPTAEAKGSTEQ
jgi:hypothetical protein